MPAPVGAPHACEIEYCMGNLDLVKEYAWTKDDYKVSETMQGYFANFVKMEIQMVTTFPSGRQQNRMMQRLR